MREGGERMIDRRDEDEGEISYWPCAAIVTAVVLVGMCLWMWWTS